MEGCLSQMGNRGGLPPQLIRLITHGGHSKDPLHFFFFRFHPSALDHPLSQSIRSCLSFQVPLTGSSSSAQIQLGRLFSICLQACFVASASSPCSGGTAKHILYLTVDPFLDLSLKFSISETGSYDSLISSTIFSSDPVNLCCLSHLMTLNQGH